MVVAVAVAMIKINLLIQLLGRYTVSIWEMLPTFRRYMLTQFSTSKYARWVIFRVYVGLNFEKNTEGGGSSPLWPIGRKHIPLKRRKHCPHQQGITIKELN
jgi:hypothetical protein